MDLNLIKTFVKLAELKSFTKTAKVLGRPKSRISRSIAKLEKELSVQLVHRTTRQTMLTKAGEEFFRKMVRIIEELEAEINALSEQVDHMSGVIRLTAPEDLAQTFLADILHEYSTINPKVKVETLITNEFVDIIKEDIDVAFRIGKLADSNLIQKKMREVEIVLAATPGHIRMYGRPKDISDLINFHFIPFKDWKRQKEFKNLDYTPSIVCDNFQLLLALALKNVGIVMLPDFFAEKHFKKGTLERILPEWRSAKTTVQCLYPSHKNIPKRVRSFIDLASNQLKL